MKKNIKSLFVVLCALVFGLSINYLYSAYGPTAPAPGLPGDLPVITEIYKTDGTTNYWQEKGGALPGNGIPGSVLDISREFKIDNLLVFKNLVVGPTLPKSLAINALSPVNTEQNVCSVTPEGKIVLCDQALPNRPVISITVTGASFGNSCSPDPGDAVVTVTNPTPNPMSIKSLAYTIGYGSSGTTYYYYSLANWVSQTASTTQPIYTFTVPLKNNNCFLSFDSIALVEVTIDGQVYADSVTVGVVRSSPGGAQCENCDDLVQQNPPETNSPDGF